MAFRVRLSRPKSDAQDGFEPATGAGQYHYGHPIARHINTGTRSPDRDRYRHDPLTPAQVGGRLLRGADATRAQGERAERGPGLLPSRVPSHHA